MNRIIRAAVAGLATLLVMPVMDAHSANNKVTWAGCSISKNAFMAEMAEAYYKKTGIKVDLKGGGATKGIRGVAAKDVNIGGTCRHVVEDWKTLNTVAEERRVQLTPVAWDALVVIVHKDNPVENITLDQLRGIYLGEITNWNQLRGKNAPIEAYARKGKISGVGRTMRELVFANYEQDYIVKHVVKESASLEKDIVTNPNGLGVTGVSSARKITNIAKILKLNGKEPSYDNIKDGQYLLYRPLYMVTHLQNADPEVRKFVSFVLSDEGKQVMRRVGTVPYEDGLALWLKYLDQQNRAIANMHDRPGLPAVRTTAKVNH